MSQFLHPILDLFDFVERLEENDMLLSWFVPMTGVVDAQFKVTGELREVAAAQTADYTTDFTVGNQHLYILVNTIVAGGDIVITGTSLSESTAVPVPADTETITVDTTATQHYQSSKKWLEITNIDISTGDIDTIDYDIGIVGYIDLGNRDFVLNGYRAEFRSSSDAADIRVRIRKVQDDGSKKMSFVDVEDIGVDSVSGGGQVYDHVRTGGDERSYVSGETIFPNDTMFVFKQGDFGTFFSSNENILEGSLKAEGLIVDFLGEPSGGISAVDHATVTLYARLS